MRKEVIRQQESNSTSFWLSVLRFVSNSHASGLGFQLEYKSTNVSQWVFRIGECGGSFTTPNGVLTSPSFPYNYPDNTDCIYTISQPTGTGILLNFLSMDLEVGCYCDFLLYGELWYGGDFLEIRDGPSEASPLLDILCCREIPAPIEYRRNQIWMK